MTEKKAPHELITGKPLDVSKVEALAALQCTHDEIASGLDISLSTLIRRRKANPEFDKAIKRGREDGTRSLRRLQWEVAKSGNTTMQIWLGKQWLRQTDKQDLNVKGNVTVRFDKEAEGL